MEAGEIQMRIAKIEAELAAIQSRNLKVGEDKAWEISLARRSLVASITYIFAAILLRTIGNQEYYLNALVPTAGYLLSTLTLSWAKARWARK